MLVYQTYIYTYIPVRYLIFSASYTRACCRVAIYSKRVGCCAIVGNIGDPVKDATLVHDASKEFTEFTTKWPTLCC